jgi:hypothetical protein
LQRCYLKHRQKLFVFLYRNDVDPTNNIAERALRPSVIHTAELSCVGAFDAIQSLFGSPALPILLLGE